MPQSPGSVVRRFGWLWESGTGRRADVTPGLCAVNTPIDTPIMSSETETANRDAVEQSFEMINTGDLDSLEAVVAEDVELRYSGATDQTGIDAYKEYIQSLHDGFSDFEAEIHDTVVDDDTVVVHMVTSGTHDGEFQGIEPTGNSFEVSGMNLMRLEDGKIVEDVNVWDNLEFFEQLEIDPSEV